MLSEIEDGRDAARKDTGLGVSRLLGRLQLDDGGNLDIRQILLT